MTDAGKAQTTAHSEGPWLVANTEVFGNADRMVYDARELAVAAVYRKRDASVIAAAPELVEALEAAVDAEEMRAARVAYEAELGASEWESYVQPWHATAVAALARARGETT